jgi:hypothetical protein
MPEEPWEWVRVTTGKGTEATYYNVASIKIVRVHRRGINPRATVCWMIAARDSETTLGGAQAQALLDYLDARIALGADEWVVIPGRGTSATYYNTTAIKGVKIKRAGSDSELTIEWKAAAKDSEITLRGDAARPFMQYLDARRIYVAGDPTN